MKATEQIKRAVFEKTFDYFLSDPEHNVVKIMDLLDKVAPDNLFAPRRCPAADSDRCKTAGTGSR